MAFFSKEKKKISYFVSYHINRTTDNIVVRGNKHFPKAKEQTRVVTYLKDLIYLVFILAWPCHFSINMRWRGNGEGPAFIEMLS